MISIERPGGWITHSIRPDLFERRAERSAGTRKRRDAMRQSSNFILNLILNLVRLRESSKKENATNLRDPGLPGSVNEGKARAKRRQSFLRFRAVFPGIHSRCERSPYKIEILDCLEG